VSETHAKAATRPTRPTAIALTLLPFTAPFVVCTGLTIVEEVGDAVKVGFQLEFSVMTLDVG
jgi:hypothetical protein